MLEAQSAASASSAWHRPPRARRRRPGRPFRRHRVLVDLVLARLAHRPTRCPELLDQHLLEQHVVDLERLDRHGRPARSAPPSGAACPRHPATRRPSARADRVWNPSMMRGSQLPHLIGRRLAGDLERHPQLEKTHARCVGLQIDDHVGHVDEDDRRRSSRAAAPRRMRRRRAACLRRGPASAPCGAPDQAREIGRGRRRHSPRTRIAATMSIASLRPPIPWPASRLSRTSAASPSHHLHHQTSAPFASRTLR